MKHSVAKKIIIICIVLFCISFVCNAINIIIFYRNLYLSDLDEDTSWQLSELQDELKSYDALDYWMKALREDPAAVILPKDEKDKTSGEWYRTHGFFYDNYSIMDITEEEAEKITKEDGKGLVLALDACYVQIADEFDLFCRYSLMDNISCFYPQEDGTAFMYFEGDHTDDNDYNYVLGRTNPFNPDLHPDLKKSLSEGSEEIVREIMNSSVDGRRFIQYYAPLFNDKGELICILSEAVWWDEFIVSIVKGALKVEALNAIFHCIILLILLFLLNSSIGKPMLILKNAMTAYADDKDTGHFVRSLVPVGTLDNEFGIFAEETAVMAVELRRYMEENLALTAEKKRLEGQLAMAVELRHQLMPNVFPAFPDEKRLEIYADQVAFEKIGGDYYDFFAIDRDHIALVIADIFDGGTVSALFMVAFKIILSQIASYGLPPSKIIEIVNNRLSRYNEDDLTLSAWFGIYEISTGRVTAVNAGHECPLLLSEDGVKDIEGDICGFIIGLTEGMTYPEYSFTLEPGNQLILYTDGILDAQNTSGEAFGYERMIRTISDSYRSGDSKNNDLYDSIQREVGAVQDAVFDHVGDEPLRGDISMLILGRTGS